MYIVKIITEKEKLSVKYKEKALVSDILKQAGPSLDMPCGGKGTCGKCRVKVDDKIVAACQTYLENDACVYLNTENQELHSVTLNNLHTDYSKEKIGMAADIGTTTICAAFYDMVSGKKLYEQTEKNPQTQFGADVLTRIEHAKSGGLAKLCILVNEQIEKIKQIFGGKISASVICGNTTMLHLFAEIDPTSMGAFPFTPKELFGKSVGGSYIPRCVSAFVGADVVCAVLASGMASEEKTSLLIDLGTNGEIVLKKAGEAELFSVSTAAGPAFEGATIYQGMLSTAGAINTVRLNRSLVEFETIGNAAEIGICGSGLIDAVAVFLQLGLIDETGTIIEKNSPYIGKFEGAPCLKLGNVILTGRDIRQMQLSKSAIRAGIETLLAESDVSTVENLYIAGAFGTYIDLQNSEKIGLIPTGFTEKTICLGNAALTGASDILLNDDAKHFAESLADNIKIVDLSGNNTFIEAYYANMVFEKN
jgi:Uncharacterized metal-binding protein